MMKDWFPLTSYDFWAYLTSGAILLAAVDRVFMASTLASRQDWTLVAVVFWAAAAYLAGQLVAIPASVLLEHLLARRVLHPPTAVLLDLAPMRHREHMVVALLGVREFAPLPHANRRAALERAAAELGTTADQLDAEAAFQTAYSHARCSPDRARRLDDFLNQYGMCRNASCACAISAVLLAGGAYYGDKAGAGLAALAAIASIGLFGRFLKFYAAFAREALRAFDRAVTAK